MKQLENLEFNLRLLQNLDNLEFDLRLLKNLDKREFSPRLLQNLDNKGREKEPSLELSSTQTDCALQSARTRAWAINEFLELRPLG